ncbi:hypothetical protein [Klebsiella pneumoniae]|uniref:hypothetical protein n=1 Tax=Klebsiella pneumoniae TaxID=573 RepID=UPI001D191449|nr:hypothetical protein [Klebsiella pneumoniae]
MPALSLSLSVAEKVRLTAGMGMWSTHPIPHSTLGSVTLSDGPMGITGGRVDERDIALLSPCGLALGAAGTASWSAGWAASSVRRRCAPGRRRCWRLT